LFGHWWNRTYSGLDIGAIGPAGIQMMFTGNV